ncbi:hypothetical protein D3C85_1391360 [compost metagenome]
MAASTPALPDARRTETPGMGNSARNALAASSTRLMVVALWSARYRCTAVMLQSARMMPEIRATSVASEE